MQIAADEVLDLLAELAATRERVGELERERDKYMTFAWALMCRPELGGVLVGDLRAEACDLNECTAKLRADVRTNAKAVRTMGERCDVRGRLLREWKERAIPPNGDLVERTEQALADPLATLAPEAQELLRRLGEKVANPDPKFDDGY